MVTKGSMKMSKFKALGLTLLAVFAMSAMVASSASAEAFVFTSEVENPTLKGEQVGSSSMEVEAGVISCSGGTFEGAMTGKAAAQVSLGAAFSGCTFAEMSGTSINMQSCDLMLGVVGVEGSNYEAEAGVGCEKAEDSIVITVKVLGITKCTVEIGQQAWLPSVTVEDTGSPTAIRAELNVSGIEYDQKAGSGLGACKSAENKTNGTYKSEIVIKGSQGGVQKKLNAQPIPQKVDVNPATVKLNGPTTSAKFTLENLVNEKLTVSGFHSPGNFTYKLTCKSLEKKGDKDDTCQEEVTCVQAFKVEAKVAVLVTPLGGAAFTIEGC